MSTGESAGTVFANVRSKLSHFSPSDFFSNLGLSKRKSTSSQKLSPMDESENSNFAVGINGSPTCAVSGRQNRGIIRSAPVQARRENSRASPPSPIFQIKNSENSAAAAAAAVEEQQRQQEIYDEKLIDVTLTSPVVQEDIDNIFYDKLLFDNDEQHYTDTLHLQHFGPMQGLIPIGKQELGIGHEFNVAQLVNSTFCDKCGDIIWGLYKQAVRCQNCHYTCHYKCRLLVTLDCRSVSDSLKSSSTKSTELPDFDDEENILKDESAEINGEIAGVDLIEKVEIDFVNDKNIVDQIPLGDSLKRLLDEYNQFAEGLRMTLDDDCTSFRGFIQIHMNFTRPINIVAGDRPPSMYDVLNADDTLTSEERRRTITSFFLPRNTVKILHITSETTTREMIVSLLKKFKVADNPKKFALYERDLEPGKTLQARLRRFSDDACPLRILLNWGSKSNKRFVLQENDTGDILWDFFEVPELGNFLKILDREEQQYVWQIRQKYDAYRFYLQCELRERGFAVQYAADNEIPTCRQQQLAPAAYGTSITSESDSESDLTNGDGNVTPTDDGTLLSDFKTARNGTFASYSTM